MKQRLRGAKFSEHFNQATLFVNSLTCYERTHLANAISFELSHCDDPVVYKTYTKLLNNIDFNLAKDVATIVGGVVPDAPIKDNHGRHHRRCLRLTSIPRSLPLPVVGLQYWSPMGLTSPNWRQCAPPWPVPELLLLSLAPAAIRSILLDILLGTGKASLQITHFEGQRSTLFDAIYIPSGAEHARALASDGRVVHWGQGSVRTL